MQVYIDDQLIESIAATTKTIGDLLGRVQAERCPPRRIVVGICCDGVTVPSDDMAATLNKALDRFDRIDILTNTREALVVDVMTHAAESLEETEAESLRVAELLTAGKSTEAKQALAGCLRVWQQVHDAVAKSIGLLGINPDTVMIRDESLMSAITRPRDALLQVRDALIAGDDVLLADILQFEFADVAGAWHSVIARLRREAEDRREAVPIT